VQPRPHVLVNMAMTADGKIDTVARAGARISGTADTARVDRLRADADAVLVGGHTLLGEDPRLTVRDPELSQMRIAAGRSGQPIKVGLVSRVGSPGQPDSLPPGSRFLGEGSGRVIVCTTARTDPDAVAWLESHGAEVIVHPGQRVDLELALSLLAKSGVQQLMVEGGSTLVAALLTEGLVDEFQLTIAPLLFGGETAPTPVGGPGWPLEAAIGLTLRDAARSRDGDMVLRYDIDRGDA
jgi:2,5-diamino-6-(ribosylamino)-4(3H)-pyrimidinone 5'-phosphate reductase